MLRSASILACAAACSGSLQSTGAPDRAPLWDTTCHFRSGKIWYDFEFILGLLGWVVNAFTKGIFPSTHNYDSANLVQPIKGFEHIIQLFIASHRHLYDGECRPPLDCKHHTSQTDIILDNIISV